MHKTEIHDLDTLRLRLLSRQGLRRVILQHLDLTSIEDALWDIDVYDAVFLGCIMSDSLMASLVRRRAVIFPELEGLPFEPYRTRLYNYQDLFSGFDRFNPCTYCETLDAKVYRHWRDNGESAPDDIMEALARRLHDVSIADATERLTKSILPENTIAIMGGHNVGRNTDVYRTVARLSRSLTKKGKFMLSGGGPGAMEATHLGACFASRCNAELDHAIDILATAPFYNNEFWLARAFDVIAEFELDLFGHADVPISLGVPTWHYGHEPPAPFASHIAKYFSNATREEGLITMAIGGLIIAPGSAGTIQEIFQDAAQNHYKTTSWISPMVFLGTHYWTKDKAAYPLLKDLSRGEDYGALIGIADSEADIINFLELHPPQRAKRKNFSYCDLFCD